MFSSLRKQPCSAGAGFLLCLRQGRTIRSSGGQQTADFTRGLHFRGEGSRQITLPFIDLQLHRLYKRAECDSSSPVTGGCVDIKQNPSCVVLIIKMYLISPPKYAVNSERITAKKKSNKYQQGEYICGKENCVLKGSWRVSLAPRNWANSNHERNPHSVWS